MFSFLPRLIISCSFLCLTKTFHGFVSHFFGGSFFFTCFIGKFIRFPFLFFFFLSRESSIITSISDFSGEIPDTFHPNGSFLLKSLSCNLSVSLIVFCDTLKNGFCNWFRLSPIRSRQFPLSRLPNLYFFSSNSITSYHVTWCFFVHFIAEFLK